MKIVTKKRPVKARRRSNNVIQNVWMHRKYNLRYMRYSIIIDYNFYDYIEHGVVEMSEEFPSMYNLKKVWDILD